MAGMNSFQIGAVNIVKMVHSSKVTRIGASCGGSLVHLDKSMKAGSNIESWWPI